jgi:two-component system chemotaxis sensor kinase CheA
VADDGAGLSRERILKRAAEQGLRADDAMSDAAVFELIFAPGFSTATAVSDVSGRGVGMDVVRRNVRELGGHVEVSSQPGKGTHTVVRLPLTLAIMDGMELAVGNEVYIAPLSAIVESLRPSPGDLKSIAGDSQVLNLRGEIVPVLSLARALGTEHGCKPGEEVLVVVENGGRRAALAADALLGQQQIVVKNLEGNFGKVSGVAGATILGNGAVSLILDIPELLRVALGSERHALAA